MFPSDLPPLNRSEVYVKGLGHLKGGHHAAREILG